MRMSTDNAPVSVHSQRRFSDHTETDLDAFSMSFPSAASPQNVYGDPDRPFAPAGQSTQMIIGATGETDFEILSTTQALYQNFDLKRVFYSAYIPLNEDAMLPAIVIIVFFLCKDLHQEFCRITFIFQPSPELKF